MSIDVNPAASSSLADHAAAASPPEEVPVVRVEHAEGEIARLIEQQAAKIPSHWFLFSAIGAIGASLVLELAGNTRASRFVGMWPTPLLVCGIYNKMIKTFGTR